ncbi:MAG: hypothetical protein HYU48_02490 [Candidatus Levybacteria bacterium]|nr:hypothetical protein [Candidatus Levybacteria bacterium]
MFQLKSLAIRNTKNWDELVKSLRKVRLFGDETIYPYKNATIRLRLINPTDVYPISKYALRGNIDIQKQLHYLFKKEKIDTLNLGNKTATIKYVIENEENDWMMSPPIVEESSVDGNKPILIDGEHRFLLARKLRQRISVVWISKVPALYPTVAKPLTWKDVKLYKTVPPVKYKREYRFQKAANLPDISSFSKIEINNKNFRYFFYRDLSLICTSSIRPVGSNTKHPKKPNF